MHFLRNALDCLPRKADDDCLVELGWIYERRDLGEARRDLAACLGLIRALAVEIEEEWMEGARYLNMQPLADAKREAERGVGEAA